MLLILAKEFLEPFMRYSLIRHKSNESGSTYIILCPKKCPKFEIPYARKSIIYVTYHCDYISLQRSLFLNSSSIALQPWSTSARRIATSNGRKIIKSSNALTRLRGTYAKLIPIEPLNFGEGSKSTIALESVCPWLL